MTDIYIKKLIITYHNYLALEDAIFNLNIKYILKTGDKLSMTLLSMFS
jgi:hypothetical protein